MSDEAKWPIPENGEAWPDKGLTSVQIYPPDVEGATRVIKRFLYGKKMATRLGRLCMTINDLGEVDIHPETLKDIYDRGLDDGLRSVPGDIHSDPDKFL